MEEEALFNYVNQHSEEYIHRLREAVALDSVSSDPNKRSRCLDMANYICKWIEKLGGKPIVKHIGKQTFPDGQVLDYPPILFGDFTVDTKEKPVLLAYCHYDVQPADIQDGWKFDPFQLVEEQGKLYGRGATDDKGPLLGWLWAIEAYKQLGIPLPVNLLLCFEGMEESGSTGLDRVIEEESKVGGLLSNVKYVCVTDNYWLTEHRPCLTYGLRGIVYFQVHIEGPKMDLHSGLFGGLVNEPMNDLIHLFSSLTDIHGNILIPQVMDSVAPVTKEEELLYEKILFDPQLLKQEAGQVSHLRESNKVKLLMNRWRFPSLSFHGIQGAFSGPGEKTVIPGKVTGKFSIRLVPHQQPEEIARHVENYLRQQMNKIQSGNVLQVEWRGASPWLADYHNSNFQAARSAFQKVYQVDPDLTREGGSIPITNTFQEYLGGEICLMPLGSPDDGAHSQNEKMNK